MRERILEILRSKMPAPVSGEVLSQELAVSRTAIWKHIQALKNEGYTIESVPKKGYILKEVPDRLKPAEVVANLKTKWLGHHIHYCELTTSTNELAKRLAGEGCEDGLVVIAEEQNSGKGRLSRGWFSPFARGVWFSVVLKPPFMPQEASKCTLLAAIAVVKAVNKYKGVQASIKWPNDVLLDGKKLVGILTEMSAEFGRINYIVIGTGINVNVPKEMVPEELRATAVSLADVAREPISRVELLADVLGYMEELYEKVLHEGFKPVLVCGDLNVAHREIDLKNWKTNRNNAGFTDEERAKITELLTAGFTDSFRHLYPEKEGAYTWWSYMFKAREKNAGWRIDYWLVSDRWADRIEDSVIYADITGSDHCPVGLVLK